MKNEKVEKTILLISFLASFIFASSEICVAIITKSQSVLMDATYDAAGFFIIGLTIFLTPLFYKPCDEKKPFGYAQVETIFTAIKVFLLLIITCVLMWDSFQVLLSGGNIVDNKAISIFQILLAGIGLTIYFILLKLNKKITSPTIEVELYSWKMNAFYSIGMSIAFGLTTLIETTPLNFVVPYVDVVFAALISLFMLPDAIQKMVKAIRSTALFAPDDEITIKMKRIIKNQITPYKYDVVFYDIINTGRKYWISIYFKTEEEFLNTNDIKEATVRINNELSKTFDYCTAELILEV